MAALSFDKGDTMLDNIELIAKVIYVLFMFWLSYVITIEAMRMAENSYCEWADNQLTCVIKRNP